LSAPVRAAAAALCSVAPLALAPAATAQSPFTLELRGPASAEYAQTIKLRGRITPTLADAPVTIVRDGEPIGRATTRADGTFVVSTRVAGPAVYEAHAGELVSPPFAPRVRVRLRVRLRGRGIAGDPLRLFVSVEPRTSVRIRVRRNGKLVLSKTYPGSARIALGTQRPSRLRISVDAEPPPGWSPASQQLQTEVIAPRLSLGARGESVRALERRLRDLRYALPRVDGYFGVDTYQALLTFQKLERLPWTGRVDRRLWHRLDRARPPRARYAGSHIEVSKARQYLLVVRNGAVTDAIHVSTGATGNTPLGRWRIYRKVRGWDWVLWYPMYFLRGFAIHGYPSVPAYPASHGCVRVPMWIAPRLFATNASGMTVYVYS
jgi:hypothetical protein